MYMYHEQSINHTHLSYKIGVDVMQSHPLCRTHFGNVNDVWWMRGGCFFAVLLLPCIVLNANRRTKMREAWYM